MKLLDILFYIAILLGILPVIFNYKYRGSRNVDYLGFLFPFVILMFIASLYEFFITDLLKVRTGVWFRVYCLLEFYTLLYFYYKVLGKNVLFLFLGTIYLINYLYLMYQWVCFPINGFNILNLDILTIVLVVISSVLWFVKIFKEFEDRPLFLNPLFYLIAVLLLNYCSTFIIFVMTDYLIKYHNTSVSGFYMINIIAGIILRLTMSYIYWKHQGNKLIYKI